MELEAALADIKRQRAAQVLEIATASSPEMAYAKACVVQGIDLCLDALGAEH